jgi:hypothetical protein
MIIGNFKYDEDQDTSRANSRLSRLAARRVVFQPSEAKADKAPSYRGFSPSKSGNVELGAARKKRRERPGLPLGQARPSEPR